jgi:hypothetical protein
VEFEASVRAALDVADEYVWIYSETPRWWSTAGTPLNLPEGYADALRRARGDARSLVPGAPGAVEEYSGARGRGRPWGGGDEED